MTGARWAWLGLVVGLSLDVGIASAAPVTFTSSPTITLSGANAMWLVTNTGRTSNDLPTGGAASFTSPGLTVQDASLGAQTDALDNGLTLWIDNAIFGSPDTVDVTGQALTSGPVTMSGLAVTVQYLASTASPTLRMRVTVQNPTAAAIDANLKLASNLGSDSLTGVRGTSSGDTTFNNGDHWVVTSDDPTTPGDPVVTHVLSGPNGFVANPVSTPGVSQTVFDYSFAGTQGILADYNLSVPAGETFSLLFFCQLSATNPAAIAAAGAAFGTDSTGVGVPPTNPPIGGDLLSGLTVSDLGRVLNWNFFGEYDLMGGGPGGSVWFVDNSGGPLDGSPTGAGCGRTPGLAIEDATLGTQSDAFDFGLVLFVDDAVFAAPIGPTLSGQTLTAGPVTMSGLAVTMQYAAASASATLRTLVSFANPGTSDVTADVKLVTNVGSDASTGVRASSSGDTVFTTADRWVVTSDDPTTPSDPPNTHVIAGPNGPPLAPSAVSMSVFTCSATNGILAEFSLPVPAGQTRRLLFFNGLAPTNEAAVTNAATFDTNPALGGDLVAGLGGPDLIQVVNWNFCATNPSVCDDSNSCTDDTCTPGPGCTHALVARAASFSAVECRTDALVAGVQGAVPAGKVETALLKKLQSARTLEAKAEMLRAAGKKGPVKRAIAKAVKLLKAFERTLRSKKAKAQLSDTQRAAFTSASSDLRADLTTLRSAP